MSANFAWDISLRDNIYNCGDYAKPAKAAKAATLTYVTQYSVGFLICVSVMFWNAVNHFIMQ
jgi:hypothetical protein